MQKEGKKTIRDYVYSSQVKSRDKFSLKTLLVQQQGLQRNFISQQSDRQFRASTARPQTMYGERVRMFLNDQNRRVKLQTQIKMRRKQSAYKIITRSNSGAQIKTVTQEDKIKMKKALGKINLLAEGTSSLIIDEQQQIQAIFHFISCLTQVDNHYQNAFRYLLIKLKELVFGNNTNDLGKQIKQLADRSKNQFLINFSYRNLGKTTFVNLCKQLLNQTSRAVINLQQAQKKQESGQQKYLEVIKQKQELIKKLKRQLRYYQEHPSQDLYPYVKKLQATNRQLKQQVQQLLQIKGDNQYTIQINQTSILLLSEQVETLKAKIYEYQLAQLSGISQIEKNSQLRQFQKNVQSLKDMLDKSKLKMEGMKSQFDKLKSFNEELVNQRSALAKRAAVGFGELTPRPKIKQIFNQKNLIFQDYIRLSKKNTTTQNIVKSLVQTIKQYQKTQTKKPQKKKIISETQKEQDIMQDAIDFIDQTKEQLKKAVQSVDEVKRSLSRQKNQKEAIQKAQNKK